MKTSYSFVLIDDEPISNQLSEIQIKRVFANANVASYLDPLAALQDFETNPTGFADDTIVFLDINMPFSGWAVLDAIQKLEASVINRFKFYILSALSDEDDFEKAKQYPMVVGNIEKPLTKNVLLELIGN